MTCLWPLDECTPPEWETLPAQAKERGRALATNTLIRLCGYRVGTCPVTIRPCRPSQCELIDARNFGHGFYAPTVVNWGGTWSNGGCNCCAHRCAVELPAPVGRIDEVKVDGVVLAPELYRVDNGNELTWTGPGECPFPRSQDMSAGDDQPGTMSVTYVNAYDPGLEGSYAMTVLAVEYAMACAGNKCRLPAGVTSIVRQGISMNIASGAFPGGMTGIAEVDAFIALWNPKGIVSPPQVWSPDAPTHRRIGS